jgi:hypothetical protein
MSRGVFHTWRRDERRSQERGTSTSRTTIVSTLPPWRLIVCNTAQVVREGEQVQTAGSLPRA